MAEAGIAYIYIMLAFIGIVVAIGIPAALAGVLQRADVRRRLAVQREALLPGMVVPEVLTASPSSGR